MPVSIQGFSVLARNASIDQRYPGGVNAFRRDCPNGTFCTDGRIVRVGFLTLEDVQTFLRELSKLGLTTGSRDEPGEVAVTSAADGAISDCAWLQVGAFGGLPVARLVGDESHELFVPESDFNAGLMHIDSKVLAESYDFLEVDESGVEVYRHRETGRLVYTGTTIQRRCDRLLEETAEWMRRAEAEGRSDRHELMSIREKARKLVVDTKGEEAAPLMVKGIAAQNLAQWDEAAEAFRRVTNLRPEFKDGWLELTRSLAALDRVEEAEACARRAVEIFPEGPDTLGNLAAVFLQSGRTDEARPIIEQALAHDPTDAKNRALLRMIEANAAHPSRSKHVHKR